MKVLGLDLSLSASGVVVIAGDELAPEDQVHILRSATLRTRLSGLERLDWLARAIRDIAAPRDSDMDVRVPVDLAAIEGYSFGSISLAHSIGELGGIVKLELHRQGIPTTIIPPATWRKQLLGKGNLDKKLVPLEMYKRYGVEQASVDALEAYAVALAAFRSSCGLDQPEPKRRRRKAAS